MDSGKFDRLARAIGAETSRRGVLRTLAGGAAALAAGSAGGGASAASRARGFGEVCSKGADCVSGTCGPKDSTGRRRCQCPPPLVACGGGCVNPLTDPNNCGGCGQRCRAVEGQSATCSAGSCVCDDCAGSDCYCLSDIDGRVFCAGVVFIEADGSGCTADAECPDPHLPGNLPPYVTRCIQGNTCGAVFACGAPL